MSHPWRSILAVPFALALWGTSNGFEVTTPDVADDECQAALQVRSGAPVLRNKTIRSVDRALAAKKPRQREAMCFGNLGSRHCQRQALANGTCVCKDGCMGADGNCWSQKNKRIGSGFTLTNMQWHSYKVYVQGLSVFGQLMVTQVPSPLNLGQDKFELYELPGRLHDKKRYALASHRWTDHVVMMDMTYGTAMGLWAAYAVDLANYHEPWDLENIMVHVCSARSKGQPDAIMIGSSSSLAGSAAWMYLKDRSFGVFGYWYPERLIAATAAVALNGGVMNVTSIPGHAAYWVPDPPFATGVLPDCP